MPNLGVVVLPVCRRGRERHSNNFRDKTYPLPLGVLSLSRGNGSDDLVSGPFSFLGNKKGALMSAYNQSLSGELIARHLTLGSIC